MKYNRFYNKDIFTAVSGSEVIFVYKRVSLKKDGKVIYPFYLVIKPFQIEFNYYGPKYTAVQCHEDDNWEGARQNRRDEKDLPELKHHELFTLTLADDYSVNKMMEKELRNIYQGSIDLSRFLIQQEESENGRKLPIDYRLNIRTDDLNVANHHIKDDKPDENLLLSYNSIKPANEPTGYQAKEKAGIIQYRTLLLDFLYDLIETEKQYSDFAYNPYFDEVEQRLMGNHFFFSLCMMYSYKFRRQKLLNEIYNKQISRKKISQQLTIIRNVAVMQNLKCDLEEPLQSLPQIKLSQRNKIKTLFTKYDVPGLYTSFIAELEKKPREKYTGQFFDDFIKNELIYHLDPEMRTALHLADELLKAENSWLKALSHSQANETITAANKWFIHIESEREYIFGIEKHISHSFIGRGVNFFRNLFHSTRRAKDKFRETRLMLELIACSSLNHESFYSTENDKLDRSARWFLDRYHVSDALKLYSPKFTILVKFFVTGVLVFTILELLALASDDFQPWFNVFLLYANLIGIAFFALFALLVFLKSTLLLVASLAERRSNKGLWFKGFLRIKYRQNRMSSRVIGFFMPKLLMAIFSGWIILLTAEEVWKSVFDVYIEKAVVIAFILLFAIAVYVMLEIQKIRPSISITQVITRTLFIIAFGLFYSNLIGITTIALSSDRMLIRSGYLENYFEAIIDGKNNKTHPYLDTVSMDSIQKILQEDRDTTGYAKDERLQEYLTKIYIHSEHNNHTLTFLPLGKHLNFLPKGVQEKIALIKIFPGMLLVNTVIALFIGIFLQMLFDRRNIAEPI